MTTNKLINNQQKMALIFVLATENTLDVAQAITQIQKYGMSAIHPTSGKTVMETLIEESGEAITMLTALLRMFGFKEDTLKELVDVSATKLKNQHPELFATADPAANDGDSTVQ